MEKDLLLPKSNYHHIVIANSNPSNNPFKWSFNIQFFKQRYVVMAVLGLTSVLVMVAIFHTGYSSSVPVLKQSSYQNEQTGDNEIPKNTISIPLGKLAPVELKSREGRNFYAFYKVPYAKPPIGERRFKLPEPIEPWEGIRTETQVAPQCLQKEKYAPQIMTTGEESCLFMNIYTPKLPQLSSGNNATTDEHLLPTLFYIHGGGFVNGNGSRYAPTYFLDEDVVLITFQYRMGPFGFLNTMDGVIPGNLGMKDQVLALKFVRDNIKYFGGDPDNVMIFGNSAGAWSVSGHLLSPMSTGLFHRAIAQSIVTLCPVSVIFNPEKTVTELGKLFHCPVDNTTAYVECLRNVDANELALSAEDVSTDIEFGPTLEYNDGTTEMFVSGLPTEVYQRGEVNKVPWIVGINSAEFNAFGHLRDLSLVSDLNNNWVNSSVGIFNYNVSSSDSLKIKNFYFGENPIDNSTVKNFTNLVSDRMINHCSKVAAVYHAAYSPVYMYYLSKRPAKSYMDKAQEGFPPDDYGVAHADELQYLFPYYDYPYIGKESEYYNFSKLLVKIWTQFAITGDPNVFNEAQWKPIKPEENFVEWYNLKDNPQMTDVILSRMNFWDQFSASELNYL